MKTKNVVIIAIVCAGVILAVKAKGGLSDFFKNLLDKIGSISKGIIEGISSLFKNFSIKRVLDGVSSFFNNLLTIFKPKVEDSKNNSPLNTGEEKSWNSGGEEGVPLITVTKSYEDNFLSREELLEKYGF